MFFKPVFSLLFLAALTLTACNPLQTPPAAAPEDTSPEKESSATIERVPTDSLESQTLETTPTLTKAPGIFLPNCDRTPEEGLALSASSGTAQDWYLYENDQCGFLLTFPPEWRLVEGANYLCLGPQDNPDIILIIGFKRDTENISITRTGVGAGDIFTMGQVDFLGQSISREVVRYQDKDKTLLYNYGIEISVGEVIFTLSLDDFQTDYDLAEISSEIGLTTDLIIESFEFIE